MIRSPGRAFPMRLAAFAILATALLAACTPRAVVAPPPPPPAPAPPPPAPSPEELARAREADARSAWVEGTQLGRQGRWYDAEAKYREAVRAQPAEPTYHMALAGALLQLRRDGEAADAMLAGIRAEEARPFPNHRVLAVDYERLVQLLTRLNRLDEARTAAERQRFHRMMRDAQRP